MSTRNLSFPSWLILSLTLFFAFVPSCIAQRPTESVLFSLPWNEPETDSPSGVTVDKAGNLYVAMFNSRYQGGSVFQLSPPTAPGETWTTTDIYDLPHPNGDLLIDKQGNLYGTSTVPDTIFELSPPATLGGTWTETILFAFPSDGTKGLGASGKLATDEDGNFYGVTVRGGLYGGGVAFELVAPKTPGNPWVERVLHNFGHGKDGTRPTDLILRRGILYGQTFAGGTNNQGIVYQLVRKPGSWTETILHNFAGPEGGTESGSLVWDESGNLYGAAEPALSSNTSGSVFELSPPITPGGSWTETTIYAFPLPGTAAGGIPRAGLVRNELGYLYGTTSAYGDKGRGSVFELKPPEVAGGDWTFVLVYDFKGGADGAVPFTHVTLSNGAIYGTTFDGGNNNNNGVVFAITR